jgi:hypothetical protein
MQNENEEGHHDGRGKLEQMQKKYGLYFVHCPVTKLNICRTKGQCQYCGEALFDTERIEPGTKIYELIEACETIDDLFAWQQRR